MDAIKYSTIRNKAVWPYTHCKWQLNHMSPEMGNGQIMPKHKRIELVKESLLGFGTVALSDISISFRIWADITTMTIIDPRTGESIELVCSSKEFTCILALATSPDPDSLPAEIWERAIPVFEGVPSNLRPLP